MTQTGNQAHKWREGEGAFIRAHLAIFEMPKADESGASKRFKVLPWGEFETRDAAIRELFENPGFMAVTDRSVAEIPQHFANRDIDAFVNVDHNSFGPSYGWIKSAEAVPDDGVYIEVEWTDLGEEAVRNRRYRYSSAEVVFDSSAWKTGEGPAEIVAITGAALTNRPAVIGQDPVAFTSLTAALSASDGRELHARNNSPGDAGEKGVLHMSESIFKGLFSRAAGREPSDDVDAATMAAELKQIRENHDQLTADLKASTSKVAELTEQLSAANTKVSEFEAKEAAAAKAGELAEVDLAIDEGRMAKSLAEVAKASPAAFLAAAKLTPKGTYAPPKGRMVTDEAINQTEIELGEVTNDVLDKEIKAYMTEHKVDSYAAAYLAVMKSRKGGAK